MLSSALILSKVELSVGEYSIEVEDDETNVRHGTAIEQLNLGYLDQAREWVDGVVPCS